MRGECAGYSEPSPGLTPAGPGATDVVGYAWYLGVSVLHEASREYVCCPLCTIVCLFGARYSRRAPLLRCPQETLRHEAGVVTAGRQQHSLVKTWPPVSARSLLHHACGPLTVCL